MVNNTDMNSVVYVYTVLWKSISEVLNTFKNV